MYAAVAAAALLNGMGIVAAYAQPIQTDANVGVADSFDAPDGAHTIAIHDINDRTYALVAGDSHLQIMDITNLADPVPVSSVYRDDGSVWVGKLLSVATYDISGRTYALLGGTGNSGIVDITQPDSPLPVIAIAEGGGGFAWPTWVLDIAIYDISGRTYAIMASYYDVHVVDITQPDNPLHMAVIYASSWKSVRNVVVHTAVDRMYALVGSSVASGCEWMCSDSGYMDIIDITHPADSFPVATVPRDEPDFYVWLGVPQALTVHDISNRTYALVADVNNVFGDSAMHILDITHPDNPFPVSVIDGYPGGFIKRGGVVDIAAHDISNRTYAVITARDGSSVQIIDITRPDNPVPVAVISDDADGLTELDGASGIAIHDTANGTYALVATRADSGVQIIDITNPPELSAPPVPVATNILAATEIAYLPHSEPYGGRDVAVHDIANRTYALVVNPYTVAISDVTYPAEPRSVAIMDSVFPNWFHPVRISIHDIANKTYAITNGLYAVHISDITHPDNPASVAAIRHGVGGFAGPDSIMDIAIHDVSNSTYVVVANRYDPRLQIIDITHPDNPLSVATIMDGSFGFAEPYDGSSIAIHDISNRTYAVVTTRHTSSVQIIDITQPDNPFPVADITDDVDGFTRLNWAWDVAIHDISNGTYAFVASAYDSGVQIIDITQPDNPFPVADITDDVDGFTRLNWAWDVAIHDISNGTYAFVASAHDSGVQIIDVTHPNNPLPAGDLPGGGAVAVHDISGMTYVFAANESGSVVIMNVTSVEPIPFLP